MNINISLFGGSHSSVTAAAIHLGGWTKGGCPLRIELMALPFYDKTNEMISGR
jgi:hypothetical protein